jgi:hypothetical protein
MITVIAAFARVHGSHQHELGRIAYCSGNPAYGDRTLLQWLTKHFQNITLKFRQFIQKKYAVMRQADLSGEWI